MPSFADLVFIFSPCGRFELYSRLPVSILNLLDNLSIPQFVRRSVGLWTEFITTCDSPGSAFVIGLDPTNPEHKSWIALKQNGQC